MRPEVYGALRKACETTARTDKERYQSILGKLMHLAQCTRPDIALLSRSSRRLRLRSHCAHMSALLDVTRYVGSTADRGITFGGPSVQSGVWCDCQLRCMP